MPTQTLPDNQNQYLDTYSKILGIQKSQADTQIAQRSAQEQAAVADYMKSSVSDPSKFDEYGRRKMSETISDLQKVAPTTWSTYAEPIVKVIGDQTDVYKKSLELNAGERASAGQAISGLWNDASVYGKFERPADITNAVEQTLKPLTPHSQDIGHLMLQRIKLPPPENSDGTFSPNQLGQIAHDYQELARPLLTAGEQVGAGGTTAPQNVAIPGMGGTAVGTRSSALSGGATDVSKVIPSQPVITLPNNQQAILNQATGQYELVKPGKVATPTKPAVSTVPQVGTAQAAASAASLGGHSKATRTAADTAPAANAPKPLQDQYWAATTAANAHVGETQTADQNYGSSMNTAAKIRTLLRDKNVRTGTGSGWMHDALSFLGMPFTGNLASDYHTLNSYLDRQANDLMSTMNVHNTDAGMRVAQDMATNVGNDPATIDEKNSLIEALREGQHRYRTGLDKVGNKGVMGNPNDIKDFQSAWADAFDPNAFRLELAQKRGDKQEAAQFYDNLYQHNPAEAQSLPDKIKRLRALSKGQLPQ